MRLKQSVVTTKITAESSTKYRENLTLQTKQGSRQSHDGKMSYRRVIIGFRQSQFHMIKTMSVDIKKYRRN